MIRGKQGEGGKAEEVRLLKAKSLENAVIVLCHCGILFLLQRIMSHVVTYTERHKLRENNFVMLF